MAETPRYGHPRIEMHNKGKPGYFNARGDFCFEETEKGLVLWLAIPMKREGNPEAYVHSKWTIDHKNECGASWKWTGDAAKPTLSPSLHAVGVWHGWVRDGYLVEA